MEGIRARDAAAVLTSVAAYGGQLAAVFHNYSLIAERIPAGFEGAINILDATVTTLKQVLPLVIDECRIESKKLFSDESIKYVSLLALECATTLAKVEPIIEEACLERKERKEVQKQKKKASKKFKPVPVLDTLSLKLDEKEFLEKIERTRWSWAIDDLETCMERLYELQLHLLLVFQVVTVGALSRDVSTGKVDIQSIVTYHERINRTANLVGIEPPKGRSTNVRFSYGTSSSSSSSYSSDSDSELDIKIRRRVRSRPAPGPPPPPDRPKFCPTPPLVPGRSSSGPPSPPGVRASTPTITIEASNPPAYSEASKSGGSNSNSDSTLLGTITPTTSVASTSSTPEKAEVIYPDEKAAIVKEEAKKEEIVEIKKPAEPIVAVARLFRSKSTGLGFKFKSFFRSKESLAEEMKRTLKDTESQLTAFVIQRHVTRAVPHSAFHSLEATHMKTILSQLNDNSWYKTFSTLDTFEHGTLDRLIHPWVNGKVHDRELIVLKVLQENKLNAWMVLLSEFLRNQPFPRAGAGRILLVICREKLIDGKPIPTFNGAMVVGPPPPPPVGFPPPGRTANSVRQPPLPGPAIRNNKISDLKFPSPPPPPPGWREPNSRPGPPPPPSTSTFGPNKKPSIRISDTTPVTELEAKDALTSYNELTLRLSDPIRPSDSRSWSRVIITQESTERHLIQRRVAQFEARAGNVLETKLRLTEQQSSQVTRLMDEIKSGERDVRFEWNWVEITLHNAAGEITDLAPRNQGPANVLGSANMMHLIAKRSLKNQYKALDVYNLLMKVPSPPGLRPGLGGPAAQPQPPVKLPLPPPIRLPAADSDTDSSAWSSDSSVGAVRRRLRRLRAKKTKVGARKKRYCDTDSEEESEEEEDVIKIQVQMKRGDDVVKKLLDLWTEDPDVKGKGKGKMV